MMKTISITIMIIVFLFVMFHFAKFLIRAVREFRSMSDFFGNIFFKMNPNPDPDQGTFDMYERKDQS